MKYGLPREEKAKKKWKSAIENELRCLQMEVCFLKDHLDEATKKLSELSSAKPSDPFAFIQGFSRNVNPLALVLENVTNNLSSSNQSLPPFSTDMSGNNNQRLFTSTLQSSQGNPFASTEEPLISLAHDPCQSVAGIQKSQIISGAKHEGQRSTERPCYQSTWDYDMMTRKAVRFHSITCMPSYKDDKSFEELRYEDYVLKGIGFSNQIQRYKDSKLRSSRTDKSNFSFTHKMWKPFERKQSEGVKNHNTTFMVPWYLTPKQPKAPWPFGPSPKSNETSNSPVSDHIGSGPLDVSRPIESNVVEAEQKRSEPIFNFNIQSNSETKNCSDIETTTKDTNLLSQIVLELRMMGEKMSSIDDRLAKMDTNLSDMSSRVSVMDSRLSAVDMFITMQRFDKTWQGLETRLAGLETPSPTKPTTSPTDVSISENSHPLSKGTTLGKSVTQNEKMYNITFGNGKNKSPQMSKFGKSDTTTPKTTIKNEAGLCSAMDTSDMNLADFVRSVSCTDITMGSKGLYTSSLSDESNVTDSSSKIKLETASIEMADLKSNSLTSGLTENSSPQENEVPSAFGNIDDINKERENNNGETEANCVVMCNEITGVLEEAKLVQKPELQVNSFGQENKNEQKSNCPLGVIEQAHSLCTKPDSLLMKDNENDADNEFVIVEKSDVEESLEDTKTMDSPIKHHSGDTSSNSEVKMYSDITEYLEINLGKKKNFVYEFGFEAKPDYLLESEGSPGYENKSVKTQENKAETPSRDDSFQQFKTNFIENKCVDAKQSSPFVFFDSKTSEESPGKNSFGKNC